MHLLITRPQPQAEQTAERLKILGHSCVVEPLLRVKKISPEIEPDKFDALIFTSVNAIQAAKEIISSTERGALPVLTTGETTRKNAFDAGFKKALSVNGSALDLVNRVPPWLRDNGLGNWGKILYPCALETAHDLSVLLKVHDISCAHWPVYHTVEAPHLSESTSTVLRKGEIEGILLYSPKTASCFFRLIRKIRPNIKMPPLFVLSEAVKNAVPAEFVPRTHVAQEPNEDSLFAALNGTI